MTYKQEEQSLKKLKRIINLIHNDKHLGNILMNYVYINDECVKIDSDKFRLSTEGKTFINPIFEMLDIYKSLYKEHMSKKAEFIRDEKIKTILK